jgi:hypothetical protein
MAVVANPTLGRRRVMLLVAATVVVTVIAASLLGLAAAHAAVASTLVATLRDPVNDVKAGDVDLTSVAVSKQDGNLVVRFRVRRPITDNVSYTASVATGVASWGLVARRVGHVDSFLLYDLTTGGTSEITGRISGRTATVRAPIAQLSGTTNATLGRVRAYFRAEPVRGRSGVADRAASTGPTVWFCLTDRRPRPKWGPCIWPGQTR